MVRKLNLNAAKFNRLAAFFTKYLHKYVVSI